MLRLSVPMLAMLSAALLLTGCRPKASQGSTAAPPPKVTLFLASPNPVPPGSVTDLAWAVQGGGELTCALDSNGDGKPDITIQPCPEAGSRSVTAPGAGNHHLTLTVRDAQGRTASQATTLRVTPGAGTNAASTAPAPAPGGSQTAPDWTRTLASGADDTATAVAADADGNTFVVGFTAGGMEGAVNSGANDAFVAALTPDGHTRWLRQFGGAGDDRAMAVALSGAGEVYVAGQTSGTVPGGSSSGSGDAFLVKFDADGKRLWVRQFGTSGADLASGVAVGPTGNVFVAGDTNGTFVDNVYAGGDRDAYVAKFDASGDLVWIRQFGGAGDDRGRDVATDREGDVLVTGFTKGTLPTNTAGGEADAFLAKFDGNGQRVWLRQFGGDQADFAYAVSIAGGSDVIVAGDSYGNLPGGRHTGVIAGFVASFDANGNRRWVNEFGAEDAVVFPNGAAVGPGGAIVVSGYTNTDLRGSGTQPGYFETFALKLGPGGQRLWLREFGKTATELKTGVAVDGQGRVTVVSTGNFVSGAQGSAGSAAGNARAGPSAGGNAGSASAGGASTSSPEPGTMHVLVVQYPP